MIASRSLTYTLALCFALGTAVACGDDEEGADGGKGGSSGSAGKGGSAGTGTGGKATGGTSGASGSSATGGKGGTPSTGGTTATGGTSGTSGAGGAGGDEGGAGPGGQGGEGGAVVEQCGTVALGTPAINESAGSGTKPDPAGGTIQDGTYVMTAWRVYAPSSPHTETTHQTTIRFSGNRMQVVAAPEQRQSGTYTTSDTFVTFSLNCPNASQPPIVKPYTATSSGGPSKVFIFTDNRVEEFTRQ
jgi:hypothetical protein